jgi:hypothetical protein
MASSFTDARKRQLARLGGAKPPTARAAIALAKSQAYQDAAGAPASLRAYATDLANYDRPIVNPAQPIPIGAPHLPLDHFQPDCVGSYLRHGTLAKTH